MRALCNGCGGPASHFGGEVIPAMWSIFQRWYRPGRSRFWTDCERCGRVYAADIDSSSVDSASVPAIKGRSSGS